MRHLRVCLFSGEKEATSAGLRTISQLCLRFGSVLFDTGRSRRLHRFLKNALCPADRAAAKTRVEGLRWTVARSRVAPNLPACAFPGGGPAGAGGFRPTPLATADPCVLLRRDRFASSTGSR